MPIALGYVLLRWAFSREVSFGPLVEITPFAGALLAGTLLFPALLPLNVFRSFAAGGAVLGLLCAALSVLLLKPPIFGATLVALPAPGRQRCSRPELHRLDHLHLALRRSQGAEGRGAGPDRLRRARVRERHRRDRCTLHCSIGGTVPFKYFSLGSRLVLQEDRCGGCGRCVEVCPHAVLAAANRRAFAAARESVAWNVGPVHVIARLAPSLWIQVSDAPTPCSGGWSPARLRAVIAARKGPLAAADDGAGRAPTRIDRHERSEGASRWVMPAGH